MKRLAAALICLLLYGLTSRADATVLFAGGEDVDFACVAGSCPWTTTTQDFRPAWARVAFQPSAGGGASDPPNNRALTPVFSPSSTLWFHAQNCWGNGQCGQTGAAPDTNGIFLRLFDSAGNPTLVFRTLGNNTQFKISSRTSGGSYTDLVTCSNTVNAGFYLLAQWDININYSSSGSVTVYLNGSQICNFSGNVTNGDGATTLNQAELAGGGGVWDDNWSEVIVATTDTRTLNLLTMEPSGSGNATQWSNSSGSTPCTSILGQSTINDANYVYTGTNSQLEQCTVQFGNGNSAPAPGVYNVLAVGMSARALVGGSGPQHFDFVTRTGGADYLSSDFAPTTSFGNFNNYLQTVNPATSSPWAFSDITAAGFNVGLESKP